jgi:hypothetical protein
MVKNQKRMPVNDLEYEDCYAEALTILREKYDSVGVPYRNEDGERVCDVETLHADDLTVLMLAWGAETAHQIRGNDRLERDGKRVQRRHNPRVRSAASGR